MPVDVTENYIRIRVEDPDQFEKFRMITIPPDKPELGIKAVYGKYKDRDEWAIQSYLFDKEKWTKDEAVQWVKDNHKKSKSEIKSDRGWTTQQLATAAKFQRILCQQSLDGEAPKWVQIFPLGHWEYHPDIGGPLDVTVERLQEILANQSKQKTEIPLDYNHQTMTDGVQAPAAGWVKELEIRKSGLWARVEWTEEARKQIEAREFRYLSPTWSTNWQDAESGEFAGWKLIAIALTNIPYFDELTELIAASEGGRTMAGDVINRLRELVGLVQDATTDAIYEAVRALYDALDQLEKEEKGGAVAAELKGKGPLEKIAILIAAAQKGRAAEQMLQMVRDELRVPTTVTADDLRKVITQRADEVQQLRSEILDLKKDQGKTKAEELVAHYQKEGKLVAADLAWAREQAAQNPLAFEKLMATAPVKLKPESAAGAIMAGEGAKAEPTEIEKRVAAATGYSAEKIAARRAMAEQK
jgi:phage I-like protein